MNGRHRIESNGVSNAVTFGINTHILKCVYELDIHAVKVL